MAKGLYLLFFSCIFTLNSIARQDQLDYQNNNHYDQSNCPPKTDTIDIDSLCAYASKFIGSPYKPAGKTPKGFDCSGFSYYCFKAFGTYLPNSSREQAKIGKIIPIAEAQAGDLIFFKGYNINDKTVHHVGIILSKKGEKIRFIHSSSSHGVRHELLESPYYKKRFVSIKRIH